MAEREAVSAPSTDMNSRSEEEDGPSTLDSSLLTTTDVSRKRRSNQSSSPATAVVVFSTLVAVCGSFVYGSAVSFSAINIIFI